MSKPLLYDLFCGAGGVTKGFQRAGFRVVGIDNCPQPHYIGDGFSQMDALEFMRLYLVGGEYEEASAFAASPPCQAYSMAGQQWRKAGKKYSDLIAAVRNLLRATGKPYVIENVPGAPLINPTILNGAFFNMRVRRTRWFETSFAMPLIIIPKEERSSFRMGRPVKEGDVITPVGHFSNVAYARKVMDISWMTGKELTQAIPPAYTEYIGKRLLELLQSNQGGNVYR